MSLQESVSLSANQKYNFLVNEQIINNLSSEYSIPIGRQLTKE
jgi:hypothetical protein